MNVDEVIKYLSILFDTFEGKYFTVETEPGANLLLRLTSVDGFVQLDAQPPMKGIKAPDVIIELLTTEDGIYRLSLVTDTAGVAMLCKLYHWKLELAPLQEALGDLEQMLEQYRQAEQELLEFS
jgi:hypothetical protein